MKIRKAKLEDKKQIMKLVRGLYGRSSEIMVKGWERNYEKLMKITLVVEENKLIIGYITLILQKNSLYISDLYILTKYRRKGIASKLIKEAEKMKKELKERYLRVDVRKKDYPAQRLYEKFGFEVWKPKRKDSLKLRK